MASRTAITIEPAQDRSNDWRRFVAGLCFIQFYSQFLQSGMDIWHWHELGQRASESVRRDAIVGAFGITSAIAFYLVGQALWYGRGMRRMVMAASLLAVLHALASVVRGRLDMSVSMISDLLLFTREAMNIVPWLGVLLVGLILACYWRGRRRLGCSPWVLMAATWCLISSGVILVTLRKGWFTRSAFGALTWILWPGDASMWTAPPCMSYVAAGMPLSMRSAASANAFVSDPWSGHRGCDDISRGLLDMRRRVASGPADRGVVVQCSPCAHGPAQPCSVAVACVEQ